MVKNDMRGWEVKRDFSEFEAYFGLIFFASILAATGAIVISYGGGWMLLNLLTLLAPFGQVIALSLGAGSFIAVWVIAYRNLVKLKTTGKKVK